MEKELYILILEDNPGDAVLQEDEIRKSGILFTSKVVSTKGGFIKELKERNPDIVLSDYNLPAFNAFDTLNVVQEESPKTPVIVVSGAIGEELAIELLHKGAADYLLKDRLSRLPFSIKRILNERQITQENEKIEKEKEILIHNLEKRVKELRCLYNFANVVETPDITEEAVLQNTIFILPFAFQYQEITCARIVLKDKEFQTENFQDTPWKISAIVKVFGEKTGTLEVCYLQERPPEYEGPFLKEEIELLNAITERLENALESMESKESIRNSNKELYQLSQLKSDFVATVSHELRTPLTTMKEFTSIILEELPGKLNQQQKEYITIIKENINRLTRLITSLLDISKIESGTVDLNRELVDIIQVVNSVVSNFMLSTQSKGLKVKTVFNKDEIMLFVDKDQMTQVFINLISNAVKFADKGSIEVSLVDNDKEIECIVSNTGKGISPKDLPRVFTKFEQFNREPGGSGEKGTGLGLAVSKAIIELHSGKISVESKPGHETKFIFTLPKYDARGLFIEHVTNEFRKANKQGTTLSTIIFDITNYESLKDKISKDEITRIMTHLDHLTKVVLRRKADFAVKDSHEILVVLPVTNKKDALSAMRRLEVAFNEYLSKERLNKTIEFDLAVANFPEDGTTKEELLDKVHFNK